LTEKVELENLHIPNIDLMITGKGTAYVAPILPVAVMTNEQIRKPQNTIGIVSRAVNPRAITLDTVEAKGGATKRLVQSPLTCSFVTPDVENSFEDREFQNQGIL
jgi:hypothetical protein